MSADDKRVPEPVAVAHTPGPWAWQRMGDMKLVGQHGRRPIVLDCVGRRKTLGPPPSADFRLRSAERDLMVPFDENHPDARLIAAAPDLLEALRALLAWAEDQASWSDELWHAHRDLVRAAIRKAVQS